jgi:hypothetical protein
MEMNRGKHAQPVMPSMVMLAALAVGLSAGCSRDRTPESPSGATPAMTTAMQLATGSAEPGNVASAGASPFCRMAAGLPALSQQLLLAQHSGTQAQYADRVNAIDTVASPADIAATVSTIHDVDTQLLAGTPDPDSQQRLDIALGDLTPWLASHC